MNSDQVALIQHSFAKIRPIAQEAAALFYGRLFEIAPDVRPLFRGDMAEQGRKLMATLGVVVNGLTDLESILPAASALAKKHVSYGVRAEHYGPVGVALLWTLERGSPCRRRRSPGSCPRIRRSRNHSHRPPPPILDRALPHRCVRVRSSCCGSPDR